MRLPLIVSNISRFSGEFKYHIIRNEIYLNNLIKTFWLKYFYVINRVLFSKYSEHIGKQIFNKIFRKNFKRINNKKYYLWNQKFRQVQSLLKN